MSNTKIDQEIPPHLVKKYTEKWAKIVTNPTRCDFLKAVESVKKLYSQFNDILEERGEETLNTHGELTMFFGPFKNPVEAIYVEFECERVYKQVCAELKIPDSEELRPPDSDKETWRKISSRMNEIFFEEVQEKVTQRHIDAAKGTFKIMRPQKDPNESAMMYGADGCAWLAYYDVWLNEPEYDGTPQRKLAEERSAILDLAMSAGWWTPLAKAVIIQEMPKCYKLDNNNRLHCYDGPAYGYHDYGGFNFYYIHGTEVPKSVIDRTYTVEDIDNEKNAEVRRIMIRLYKTKRGEEETDTGGGSRYLQDSGSVKVASDDFGTIYRKDVEGDEPIYCVKVVNSTPEPDGSYKDYWIRFDPSQYGGKAAEIPHAAVASTWREKDGSLVFADYNDYNPEIET